MRKIGLPLNTPPGEPHDMSDRTSGKYWDEIGRTFEAASSERLWRSHSDRVNGALLDEWLGAGAYARLLKTDLFDEAVTPGLYPCLDRHADAVFGVDLSLDCVELSGARHPGLNVRQADVRDLPFENAFFDCIVSTSTLDHFRTRADIDRSLSELFRVLAPGGSLVVSFDNLLNPFVALRNALPYGLLEKIGLVPYFVGRTFGRRGLIKALEQAGFDVRETRAIMHCPRALAVPLARRRQEKGSPEAQQRFLESLIGFERMAHWPTAGLTGHFIAARAVKP